MNGAEVSVEKLRSMLLTRLIDKGLELETAKGRVDSYLEAAAGEDAINKKILEAIGQLLSTDDEPITVEQVDLRQRLKIKLIAKGMDEETAEQKAGVYVAAAQEDGHINKEIMAQIEAILSEGVVQQAVTVQIEGGQSLKEMLKNRLIEKGLDAEEAIQKANHYLENAQGDGEIKNQIIDAIGGLLSLTPEEIRKLLEKETHYHVLPGQATPSKTEKDARASRFNEIMRSYGRAVGEAPEQ